MYLVDLSVSVKQNFLISKFEFDSAQSEREKMFRIF